MDRQLRRRRLILGINLFTVFSYGSSTKGIKREWFLRSVIALIILMFAIVVIGSVRKIDWSEVGKGFIGWYRIPVTRTRNTSRSCSACSGPPWALT